MPWCCRVVACLLVTSGHEVSEWSCCTVCCCSDELPFHGTKAEGWLMMNWNLQNDSQNKPIFFTNSLFQIFVGRCIDRRPVILYFQFLSYCVIRDFQHSPVGQQWEETSFPFSDLGGKAWVFPTTVLLTVTFKIPILYQLRKFLSCHSLFRVFL